MLRSTKISTGILSVRFLMPVLPVSLNCYAQSRFAKSEGSALSDCHTKKPVSASCLLMQAAPKGNKSLIIPVIFHVVYANTTQEILGAAAEKAASDLNPGFAGNISDTASVYRAFKSIIGSPNVPFVLPHIIFGDPLQKGIKRISRTVRNKLYSPGPVIGACRIFNSYSKRIRKVKYTLINP